MPWKQRIRPTKPLIIQYFTILMYIAVSYVRMSVPYENSFIWAGKIDQKSSARLTRAYFTDVQDTILFINVHFLRLLKINVSHCVFAKIPLFLWCMCYSLQCCHIATAISPTIIYHGMAFIALTPSTPFQSPPSAGWQYFGESSSSSQST